MNKSLSYVNLSLELHVVLTFWLGSDTADTFSLYITQQSYELDLRALKMDILCCRTDICSCKLSAKVSAVLGNPFLVPFLHKLNHNSVRSIQISTEITCKQFIPLGKAMCFWSDPRCFGSLSKCQHNIEISIKSARVSRLSVSCDYALTVQECSENGPFGHLSNHIFRSL